MPVAAHWLPARGATVGWLRVTARREAIRQVRTTAAAPRWARTVSTRPPARPSLRAAEVKDALRVVASLPSRKRAVLMLHVAATATARSAT